MRLVIGLTACAATLGIGFAAGRVKPATAKTGGGKHGDHDMAALTSMPGFQQSAAIPASASTAVERIAKSPRHGEWVSIKVNATTVRDTVFCAGRTRAPRTLRLLSKRGRRPWRSSE